jgi:hypothetical protein
MFPECTLHDGDNLSNETADGAISSQQAAGINNNNNNNNNAYVGQLE